MPERSDNLQGMSKDELIAEIQRLRKERHPGGPLGSEPGLPKPAVTRAEREEFHTDIEFIFDLDVVRAKGLNISDTGIAFLVDQPPPVEMRFTLEDEVVQYKARLVRTQKMRKGGFLMAFQFAGKLEPPPLPEAPDEDSPIRII